MDVSSPFYYFLIFPASILLLSTVIARFLPTEVLQDPRRNMKLEGLRGLLAPTVFFHHALITFYFYSHSRWESPPSDFYTKLGSAPVLIFFFITGFLFWEQSRQSDRLFSSVGFLKKRFRRLAPAYYASLTLVIVLVFSYSNLEIQTSVPDFVSNIIPWLLFGLPWGEFPAINGFVNSNIVNAGVLWTIRYEWLFYLSFLFIRRFSTFKKYLIFIIVLVIIKRLCDVTEVMAFCESIPVLKSLHKLFTAFLNFMIIGFNFGILSSYLNRPKYTAFLSKPISTAIGVMALFAYFGLDSIKPYSDIGSILLFLFFIVVVLNSKAKHPLHWNGFQALGHVSYSVYLLHGIVLFVGVRFLNQLVEIRALASFQYWAYIFFLNILVFLLSFLSFKWFELPFLGAKKHQLK